MRPGRSARVAFVLAGLAVLAVGLGRSPARRPATSGQIELHLAVESLALDRDLVYATADAERFRAAFGPAALAGFRLRAGAGPGRDGESAAGPRLRAPRLWSAAAAAARRAGGWPAVHALQWLSLFAGAGLLLRAVRPRLGSGGAALTVGLTLGATAAGFAWLYLVPETVAFLALAVAAALVWGRRTGPESEPGEIWAGEASAGAGLWRWPLAGLALGAALAAGPPALALAGPFVAAAPAGRRASRALLLLAGAALGFAASALAGGWPWPPLELRLDPKLLGWAGIGLAVGRHAGLLGWYAAALAGLLAVARDEGRRWIPWAVLAAAALQVVTSPFDLGGDSGAPGAPWFLPALALLPVAAARPPARAAALALAAVSLLLVAPGWLAALGLEGRAGLREVARVRAALPLDTTLRELPGAVTLDRAGIALTGFAPEVFAGGDGRLRLLGARAGLLLESAAPLASVRLELGAAAPADLAVAGATAGDLVLRPDGELALDVELGAPARRHPTWRSPRGAWLYRFSLELPRAPAAPLPLDISLARPAGLGAAP